MEGHATSTTGSASAATSTGGTSTGSVTSVTSPSSTDAIIQVGLTVQNLMYTQDFHILYIYKDGTWPVLQCLIAWMKCGVSGIEEKRTIRFCPPSAGWCYFSHQYGASAHYKPIDYLSCSQIVNLKAIKEWQCQPLIFLWASRAPDVEWVSGIFFDIVLTKECGSKQSEYIFLWRIRERAVYLDAVVRWDLYVCILFYFILFFYKRANSGDARVGLTVSKRRLQG